MWIVYLKWTYGVVIIIFFKWFWTSLSSSDCRFCFDVLLIGTRFLEDIYHRCKGIILAHWHQVFSMRGVDISTILRYVDFIVLLVLISNTSLQIDRYLTLVCVSALFVHSRQCHLISLIPHSLYLYAPPIPVIS